METVQPTPPESPQNVPVMGPATQKFVQNYSYLNIMLGSLKNLLLELEAGKRQAANKLGTPKNVKKQPL